MTEEIKNLCINFKNEVEKLGIKNSTLKIEIRDNAYQKLDNHYNIPITVNKEKAKESVEFIAISSLNKILYSYVTNLKAVEYQ